jgi:cytochrome c5
MPDTAHTDRVADYAAETYGPETCFQPGGKCVYKAELKDQSVTHHEMMFDEHGELIYDHRLPVQYAIGSAGRSYVMERDGRMFMSPISWYSIGEWDLTPEFAADDSPYQRRAGDQCFACHAGRVDVVPGFQNRYQSPFAELAIGCERCHGPGRDHVNLRSASFELSPGQQDTIVNPARLEPVRRESVCNQCHLQGVSRVPRYGRTAFDFRPGQSLEDVLTVLTHGTGISDQGTTKAVSQVEQMRESSCFRQSGGKLGCISCHDPHSIPAPRDRVEFYRKRCMNCHGDQECSAPLEERVRDQQNSCIDCHMPRRGAHNVAHAAQTDHRVLRSPSQVRDEQPQQRQALFSFFDDADRRMQRWEVQRVIGLAIRLHDQSFPDEVEALLGPVHKVVPDDLAVLEALGDAAWRRKQFSRARHYFESALQRDTQHEAILLGLVKTCQRTGDYENGLKYLDRLLAVNPWQPELYIMQAEMLKVMGRLPDAIRAAEAGVQLEPKLTYLRAWLVESYEAAGMKEKSIEHKNMLRRIDRSSTGMRKGAEGV